MGFLTGGTSRPRRRWTTLSAKREARHTVGQARIRAGGITVPSRSPIFSAGPERGQRGRRQAADDARRRRPGRGQPQDGVAGGQRGGRGLTRVDRARPAGGRRAGLPSERGCPCAAPRRHPHGVDRAAPRRRRRPVLRDGPACGAGRRRGARGGRALGERRRRRRARAGTGGGVLGPPDRRADPRARRRRPVVPRLRGGLGHRGRVRGPGARAARRRRRGGDRRRRRGVRGPAPRGGRPHPDRLPRRPGRAARAARRLPGRPGGGRDRPGPGARRRRPPGRRARRAGRERAVPHGRPADGAVHRAGRRDRHRAAGAAPARVAAAGRAGGVRRLRHRGPAVAGRDGRARRTPGGSARGPRTCCSPGWRARPAPRRSTRCRRCWSRAARGSSRRGDPPARSPA